MSRMSTTKDIGPTLHTPKLCGVYNMISVVHAIHQTKLGKNNKYV